MVLLQSQNCLSNGVIILMIEQAGCDAATKKPTYTSFKMSATYRSVTRLGDILDFGQFLKPLAAINLPKSSTFSGTFCKDVKIYHFSSEIIFGQLL